MITLQAELGELKQKRLGCSDPRFGASIPDCDHLPEHVIERYFSRTVFGSTLRISADASLEARCTGRLSITNRLWDALFATISHKWHRGATSTRPDRWLLV